MCELLGLAFNEPVTAGISFRGFRQRGDGNPDGWGIAWFENGRPRIRKEAASAARSTKAAAIPESGYASKIFIGHVRKASQGHRRHENTHPFFGELDSVPVVFAHNGTLCELPEPALRKPSGETDSERAFCLLLSWMEAGRVPWSDFAEIEEYLRYLNGHGTMNLLFSNGQELFAYRDRNGYNGLCLTRRQESFPVVTLKDEDWEVDLAQTKRSSEAGFVIATRPLTDEEWTDLKPGALLVIRDGEAVYGYPSGTTGSSRCDGCSASW